MAGDDSTATVQAIQSLLRLLRDVARTSATGFKGRFKKDCTCLSRRVASLSHLLEEIRDFQGDRFPLHMACSSLSFRCSISQLTEALKAASKLLRSAGSFDHIVSPEKAALELTSQFQWVTCKLETALAYFPFGDFEISEDVKEHVYLLRVQLKRAAQGYGVRSKVEGLANENLPLKASDAVEEPMIPVDFFCPISLQVFRDPVIVSTGQTYERSYIQRWIKSGKTTCPKTRQQLKNLTLTPNYVLKSLIAEWCTDHRRPKKIENIVGENPSQSIEEQRAAMSEIPSLSERSINNQRAAMSEIPSLSERSISNRLLIAYCTSLFSLKIVIAIFWGIFFWA